jgi:hypothetical protein
MLLRLFLFGNNGVVNGGLVMKPFEWHIEDIELDTLMIVFKITQWEYWEYRLMNQMEW